MEVKTWPIVTGSIRYELLSPKYLDSACDVIKNALFVSGHINKAIGIPNDPEALAELDQLPRTTAKDGVSVVAIDQNTDKVAGVAFNKLLVGTKTLSRISRNFCSQVKSEPFFEDLAKSFKNQKSRQILDFIVTTEGICDLFDVCQVDCVMEIFLLGTSSEYRRQGIAKKLCEVSIEIARNLSNGINIKCALDGRELVLTPVPRAVTAIFNSFIPQRIGRQLGFEIAAERSNTKVELAGRVLEIPAETPTTTVEYKKL
jgi:GNAT superfamily N-acetyltransferase